MQVSRQQILVAHLIRCDSLIKRAVDRLEASDLAKLGGPVLGYIWSQSAEHYRTFNCIIPRHTLEANLSSWLADNHMDQLSIDEAVEFIIWAYDLPEAQLNIDEALQYLKDVLEETRVRGPLVDALGDGRSAAEVLEIVQKGLTAASVTIGEPISPLSTLDKLIGQKAPEPLGGSEVMYFNKLLNGGVLAGDIIALLGPTGGFKTTLAVDVVCAMARMHERSAYFLFEQAYATGDMPIRFLSRLTGISRDRLGKVKIDELLPEEQTKILEARTIDSYINLFDRTQKADKIEDVAEMVHQLCVSGRKPKLVVIDQALAWVEGSQLATGEDDALRKTLRTMVIRLKREVAEKFGTVVLLMHQIVAEKIDKKASHKFKGNDSAECKSFSFWADFEIVLCNVCKETKCLFGLSEKTRRGEKQQLILRAKGETCQLTEATDMKVQDYDNKFIPIDKDPTKLTDEQRGKLKADNTV